MSSTCLSGDDCVCIEPPLGCSEYSDCIQRETWWMEPYTGVYYYLGLGRLQNRLRPIYHGQPYARVDLNQMPESTLSPSQRLRNWPQVSHSSTITHTDERPPYIALHPFWFSYQIKLFCLKGQCHEIFDFCFWSWISFPQAPEYTITAISNFFENSWRYSRLKVHHRCRWHRWQMEKIFKLKNFNSFAWTSLGSTVNI